jgi:hypothetical protein
MSSIRAKVERVTDPPFGTGISGKWMSRVGKVAVTSTLPPMCPGDVSGVPSLLV